MSDSKRKYRSSAWFEKLDKDGFIHRSWVGRGLPEGIFDGRPIIGICNTWSELTPCNLHFREIADHVKRGVWETRRHPVRVPGHVARRDEPAADGDALPQPRVDGRRGIDSRQSDRRRRAALRLRQDDARARHGRGELRSAGDRGVRRADAERQVSRQADRLGHGCLAVQRGSQGRPDDAEGVHAGRVLHVALDRHLQRHGHGVDAWPRWSRRWG